MQVIATVMSSNPEVSADIPALIGASAALSLSGLPFDGPVGAARVGFLNGAKVVIVLSHNGMDVDLKMAGRVTGIDAIFGGHTHDGVPSRSRSRTPRASRW